jgi:hypothetical protein
MTTQQIAAQVLRSGAPKSGLLTVQRTWRDFTLPGYELMGALARAWRECARLVCLAHGGTAGEGCFSDSEWDRECVSSTLSLDKYSCLLDGRRYFEMSVNLETSGFQEVRFIPIERPKNFEEARSRYGEMPVGVAGDAIEDLPRLVAMGRTILSRDKSLLTTVHYYKAAKIVDFSGFLIDDRPGLLLHGNLILERAAELEADSVAVSSEIWFAEYGQNQPIVYPGDRQDRREALSVQAVRADGTARLVMVPFTRGSDGTKIFEPPVAATTVLSGLDPLRELWNLRRWWVLIDPEATRGC